MLLLKLGSELQNLVKKFQSARKIKTKYRPNFHEVECTGGGLHCPFSNIGKKCPNFGKKALIVIILG